ncbi:MAG: MBOAT family protein [Planctomycetota bacterium]|nr:MAG: MBOAT family protein [Planctomycetota bacterium]
MSFDSLTFWIFFAVAWTTWRFLPFSAAKSTALFLSLFFYAWWNPWFVTLIAASALVDYRVGQKIFDSDDEAVRKKWLLASLTCNLGLLAVFKFGPFTVTNVAGMARTLGFDVDWELSGWIIPVGISFYTFQTLSYSIDIYRRALKPCDSFRDFFLFVSFFPQLVAGPIVRARDLLPQLRKRRPLRAVTVYTGLYYVISGLFLKVVVADNLAPAVGRVFRMQAIPELTPVEAWLGVVYFSFQIFCDFAGYSGIAIGLAYLMGLRFPLNFLYPYISRGLSEFWTRWHISLSQWLRDYLYIPLGGNRAGTGRMYVNLMLTMLLGGLWHGASWTFVAWGGLHGLGLCVERAIRGNERSERRFGRPRGVGDLAARMLQMAFVYVFVLTTWVFFRAESFAMAWALLGRMFVAPFREPLGLESLASARYLVLLIPVVALHLGQIAHEWFGLRKSANLRAVVAAVLLFLLTVIRRGEGAEFIYFQF